MYNYHFESILAIDIMLLGVLISAGLVVIITTFVKELAWNKRAGRLLNIKQHICELMFQKKNPADVTDTPFITQITPQQFLDIEANKAREAVSFNDSERDFLKNCFIHSGHIASLQKTAAKSGNKLRKIEALLCLGYARAESAEEIIKKSLYDKDEDVSYFSIIALGQIKTASSAKALLEFLRKDTASSYKIVSILEDFPSYIADDVIALVEDPHAIVKVWGMKLLPKFAEERHIKTIEALTGDKDDAIRASACECLGNIGSKASKDALIKCLKDESWLVRMHAVKALYKTLGHESVKEVMPLINDASWSVNAAVKDVMVDHPSESLPYIEQFISGNDTIAKNYSLEILRDSGYIRMMLRYIIGGGEKEKEHARRLLETLVKIKAHLSLESEISRLDRDMQAKILGVLGGIDKKLAEHIEQKIIHGAKET